MGSVKEAGMSKEKAMPVITAKELGTHINDEDFPERFGDPVEVVADDDRRYACMTKNLYDRIVGETDDRDYEIKYWIYELEFSETGKLLLDNACTIAGMSMEEFIYDALWQAMRMAKKDPEGFKRMHEKHLAERAASDITEDMVRLVRYYPVYWDETEAQAHDRCLREEMEAPEREMEAKMTETEGKNDGMEKPESFNDK